MHILQMQSTYPLKLNFIKYTQIYTTQKIERAKFGGKLFCTPEYQEHYLCNNQWITLKQKVKDQHDVETEAILFVCHITYMYLHRLRRNEDPMFIIEGDWYEFVKIGTNRLEQVKYVDYYNDRFQFLDLCIPETIACFPVDPFNFDFSDPQAYTDPEVLFNVIRK